MVDLSNPRQAMPVDAIAVAVLGCAPEQDQVNPISARAVHLSEEEVDELIARAGSEVHQEKSAT